MRIGKPTQALLAANLLLAMVVALQVTFPAGPSAVAAETDGAGSVNLPEFADAALDPPELAALAEMLERPLFFGDRRLPEPPKQAPPPPPKPLMLSLQGVALAGGSRAAVLRNTSNKLLLTLAEGDVHEGWTLVELTTSSARFRRGEQETELQLDPEAANARR